MDTVTGPPDFVGVGTNKSGTTWWHRLIGLHPGVHVDPDRPKELHHFDRFWCDPFTDDDVTAYHRRFPRPAGSIVGEWTPRYAADVWVPPLLHRAAPDAAWLVMLRDPWERFVSEVTAARRRGTAAPLNRLPDLALARSRYAEQLRRLRDAHPPERVLVLQYEQCRREPVEQLHRTQRFLDLEPWTPDGDEVRRLVNAAAEPPAALPDELCRGVLDALAQDLAELLRGPDAEAIDPSLWPSLRRSG
jgi:hypothetical protein